MTIATHHIDRTHAWSQSTLLLVCLSSLALTQLTAGSEITEITEITEIPEITEITFFLLRYLSLPGRNLRKTGA